ncbi:MAG: hypothetical protein SFW67_03840 [Myxococcaceae bacterium]|nr:hypothetical protein [Myxococcaceae bacterium]
MKSAPSRARDEQILGILEGLRGKPAELSATFYELARHGAGLAARLVTSVAAPTILECLSGAGDADLRRLWSALSPNTPFEPADARAELQRRALALGSRANPAVGTYLSQKLRAGAGPLTAFGASFDRLMEKPSADWTGTVGQRLYESFIRAYASPLAATLSGIADVNASTEVQRALEEPPITGRNGAPKKVSDVAVLVNGWFNFATSAPAVFRLARHSGAVVIASSNPHGPEGYRLRALTHVDGVPVPPELKGTIWAIGDLSPNLMSWPQASDLLIEHLEVVDREFGRLRAAAPALAKVPSFRDGKTVVFGHSQGGPAAMAARDRLQRAGRSDVIDGLVGVCSSTRGADLADGLDSPDDVGRSQAMASLSSSLVELLASNEGRLSLETNDPDFHAAMRSQYGWDPKALIDLSYVSQLNAADRGKTEPFLALAARLAGHRPGPGGWVASDGLVSTASSREARNVVIDSAPKTHLLAWQDQDSWNRILQELDPL